MRKKLQCLQKVFTPLDFFHILFCYSLNPIMSKWNYVFRNVNKINKKKKKLKCFESVSIQPLCYGNKLRKTLTSYRRRWTGIPPPCRKQNYGVWGVNRRYRRGLNIPPCGALVLRFSMVEVMLPTWGRPVKKSRIQLQRKVFSPRVLSLQRG